MVSCFAVGETVCRRGGRPAAAAGGVHRAEGHRLQVRVPDHGHPDGPLQRPGVAGNAEGTNLENGGVRGGGSLRRGRGRKDKGNGKGAVRDARGNGGEEAKQSERGYSARQGPAGEMGGGLFPFGALHLGRGGGSPHYPRIRPSPATAAPGFRIRFDSRSAPVRYIVPEWVDPWPRRGAGSAQLAEKKLVTSPGKLASHGRLFSLLVLVELACSSVALPLYTRWVVFTIYRHSAHPGCWPTRRYSPSLPCLKLHQFIAASPRQGNPRPNNGPPGQLFGPQLRPAPRATYSGRGLDGQATAS